MSIFAVLGGWSIVAVLVLMLLVGALVRSERLLLISILVIEVLVVIWIFWLEWLVA